jgi:hypothetical protein
MTWDYREIKGRHFHCSGCGTKITISSPAFDIKTTSRKLDHIFLCPACIEKMFCKLVDEASDCIERGIVLCRDIEKSKEEIVSVDGAEKSSH